MQGTDRATGRTRPDRWPVVAAALLAAVVLPVAAGGCRRLSHHPLVVEAAEEVRGNARVADVLGRPVSCGSAVRGTANETDGIAMLQFDASGPGGTAVVAVEGKKMQGDWGVTHLELRPATGAPLVLTADLEARVGVDTPAFDPTAAPAAPSGAPPPPGEIEITLPPGPPGQ
jgi:hypothetical protein